MQSFTKEQIDAARTRFKDALRWPVSSLEYKGRTYPYFVIPVSALPSALPNGVMRMTPPKEDLDATNAPEKITLFGVAESVPEASRQFCVIHEIEEFVHIGIDHCGRCAESAENEINLVVASQLAVEEKKAHVVMRTAFFRDLIAYAGNNPKAFTPDDVAEFQRSLISFETAAVLFP